MRGNLCTKGPFEMENTLTIHTQHCLYLTVKLHLSNTTESNISDNNEYMEVVSVKLMYLCHVLHRLSKHFLLSLSMSLDLPKVNVKHRNITLASFSLVWVIPFKIIKKLEIARSSHPKQSHSHS